MENANILKLDIHIVFVSIKNADEVANVWFRITAQITPTKLLNDDEISVYNFLTNIFFEADKILCADIPIGLIKPTNELITDEALKCQ